MGTNGQGQVLGGQPGTPKLPPFQRIDGCSSQRIYLPTAPKAVSYGNRVLRFLLGIGGGLRGGDEIEVVTLFFSHYKSSTSSFTVPDFFQLLFGQYSYTGRIYIRVRNYNGFGFFIIATYNNCMTTV